MPVTGIFCLATTRENKEGSAEEPFASQTDRQTETLLATYCAAILIMITCTWSFTFL